MGALLFLSLYGAVRASSTRARTELEWYQSEGWRAETGSDSCLRFSFDPICS